PLPGGEQAFVRALSVPLLGRVASGFMVPMRARKRKGTFHEPKKEVVDLEGLMHLRFMVPMHAQKRKDAFHEPAAVPPGFGVRQSSGAFSSGPRAQKRQRTASVQDASAPAAASSRFKVPMHVQERKEALHEPQ